VANRRQGESSDGGTESKAPANGGCSTIKLVVPQQAEYLAVCRLVAGALGAQEAADEETIADLKLMVTEACNCFLSRQSGGEYPAGIEVEFASLPGAVAITVADPDRRFQLQPAHDEQGRLTETGLALTIVRALADDFEQTGSESGGSVLRLIKRLR